MKAKDIARTLEAWAPPSLAEGYDNVGLIVGLHDQPITGVLVALDVTEAVLDEAAAKGCNMVVTHHPIWFTPRKRLNGEDYVSRLIMRAVKQDIALYAFHTNLDAVQDGVNRMIGHRLGIHEMQVLQPKRDSSGAPMSAGSGMVGELPAALPKDVFLAHVKKAFGCGGIRYADAHTGSIHRVAWCGGAGSFLIQAAINAGAQALVTADITYHKFFENEDRLLLLDIGHFESEQFTSDLITHHLLEKFPNFAVRLSETCTNPVKYY